MQGTTRSFIGFAATGMATVGIAAFVAAPLAPSPALMSAPTVTSEVRLAAVAVPPGGLISSFLNNQAIYCSLICPYLLQGAVTVPVALLQSPGVFVTSLQSGNVLKAIGSAAASVTGTANAAATPAILKDGTIVAPRALNALEVAVVGVLSIGPAAAGGLPGIVAAIQTARQDTFAALNRQPIEAGVQPTVHPHGVVQVVVVESMNVVGAVIFQGLNEVLQGGFDTADVAAQTLVNTGNPVRAVSAGAATAAAALNDARNVVAAAVETAGTDIRAAIEESHAGVGGPNSVVQQTNKAVALAHLKVGKSSTLTKSVSAKPTAKPALAKSLHLRPLREVVAKVRGNVRRAVTAATERTHRSKASATD